MTNESADGLRQKIRDADSELRDLNDQLSKTIDENRVLESEKAAYVRRVWWCLCVGRRRVQSVWNAPSAVVWLL